MERRAVWQALFNLTARREKRESTTLSSSYRGPELSSNTAKFEEVSRRSPASLGCNKPIGKASASGLALTRNLQDCSMWPG